MLFSALCWLVDLVRGCKVDPCSTNPFLSSSSSCSALGLPPSLGREHSAEWIAPDRRLRGWNVSLALQGSDPPEHWRTAQSLLINHCQDCPGPGPNNHGVQPLFFLSLSHTQNSYICLLSHHILWLKWILMHLFYTEVYSSRRKPGFSRWSWFLCNCVYLPLSSPLYSAQLSNMSLMSATNSSLAMYSPSLSFLSMVDRSMGVWEVWKIKYI